MEMEEIKLKSKFIDVEPLNQDYTPFLRLVEQPIPTETSLSPSGTVSTDMPGDQSPKSKDCGNSQNTNFQVTANKIMSPEEPIYDGPYTGESDVYYYYDYEYKPDNQPDRNYDCEYYYAPGYNQQIQPQTFETRPYAGYHAVDPRQHAYSDGYSEYYSPQAVSSGYGYAYDGSQGDYAPKTQAYEYHNQAPYSNAQTTQYGRYPSY
jgi:hypothetical protein